MLISGVLPLIPLYCLPHWQWTCDKTATRCSLFCKHLTMTTQWAGCHSGEKGRSCWVRPWLSCKEVCSVSCNSMANNIYYHTVRIAPDVITLLQEDGDLTGLRSMTLQCLVMMAKNCAHKTKQQNNKQYFHSCDVMCTTITHPCCTLPLTLHLH